MTRHCRVSGKAAPPGGDNGDGAPIMEVNSVMEMTGVVEVMGVVLEVVEDLGPIRVRWLAGFTVTIRLLELATIMSVT